VVPGAREVSRDRFEQALRRNRDLIHRSFECRLMTARWLGEPAYLADELAGGGSDLVIGGYDVSVAQGLDASAHGSQR